MRAVVRFLALMAAVALPLLPASAEQRLYHQTVDGWFIYVEDRSCVLYADFDEDTMLRFSHRSDVQRLYFTVMSGMWTHLSTRIEERVMIGLQFPDIAQNLASSGTIIRNIDGRMAYTGNGFAIDEVLRFLSTGGRMAVLVDDAGNGWRTVATFQLGGGAIAAMYLAECNRRHFP